MMTPDSVCITSDEWASNSWIVSPSRSVSCTGSWACRFMALLLTGLAFAYPALFWMTALVCGGDAARVMHPWIGVVFATWDGADARSLDSRYVPPSDPTGNGWPRSSTTLLISVTRCRPPESTTQGKSSFFWVQGVMAVGLVVTGLPLWLPDTFEASAPLLATARLLHYTAALGGGLLLVLHVYLGTVAYPGTARGMIDGRVDAPLGGVASSAVVRGSDQISLTCAGDSYTDSRVGHYRLLGHR